jgi:hypothetical protein
MWTENNSLNLNESVSELESLGLSTSKLNELNDVDEIGNLVENLKQMFIQDYKSTSVFTDWIDPIMFRNSDIASDKKQKQ